MHRAAVTSQKYRCKWHTRETVNLHTTARLAPFWKHWAYSTYTGWPFSGGARKQACALEAPNAMHEHGAELLHVPRVAPSNPPTQRRSPTTCASPALVQGCKRRKAWDLWEGSWELRALTPSSRTAPAAALSQNEAGTTDGRIAGIGQEEREGGMETSANGEAAVVKNECSQPPFLGWLQWYFYLLIHFS